MIDHFGFDVRDYEKSKAFYRAALAPLGYELVMEFEQVCGFGAPGQPDLWMGQAKGEVTPSLHFAVRAPNRAAVDAFHEAALAAGGRDNGPPGLRPEYHATYYAAFVFDPDGNNLEAVCHDAG